MPYAIFSPEVLKDGSPSLGRKYPWGQANVMDPAQSDFAALRNAVVGEFASVSLLTSIEITKWLMSRRSRCRRKKGSMRRIGRRNLWRNDLMCDDRVLRWLAVGARHSLSVFAVVHVCPRLRIWLSACSWQGGDLEVSESSATSTATAVVSAPYIWGLL